MQEKRVYRTWQKKDCKMHNADITKAVEQKNPPSACRKSFVLQHACTAGHWADFQKLADTAFFIYTKA